MSNVNDYSLILRQTRVAYKYHFTYIYGETYLRNGGWYFLHYLVIRDNYSGLW